MLPCPPDGVSTGVITSISSALGVALGLLVALGFSVGFGVLSGGSPSFMYSISIKPFLLPTLTLYQSPDLPVIVTLRFCWYSRTIL